MNIYEKKAILFHVRNIGRKQEYFASLQIKQSQLDVLLNEGLLIATKQPNYSPDGGPDYFTVYKITKSGLALLEE